MGCNRFNFFLMRCFINILFLILSLASISLAGDSVSTISDKPLKESPSGIELDGFDDFEEFDTFEEFGDENVTNVYDPLGTYNRFMTRVNDNIYVWVFKPVVKGYCFIIRKPVRLAISRCFTNGLYPVRFVNNLLQMKVKRSGIETARFCVNSTLGVAGLFDPAKECFKLDAYPEDFGQTMGHYGVGSGFHIVVPVMGPSNLRDLIGFFPDTLLRPMTYVRDIRATIAVSVVEHFNRLSLFMDEYDSLRKDAFDLYIFQRDAYEMNREKEINK